MGIYVGMAAAVLVIGILVGFRNVLSGVNVRLYVTDVSGDSTSDVSSILIRFRTPFSGNLTFDSKTTVGYWDTRAIVSDSTGKVYVSAWSYDPNRPAEIMSSTNLAPGFSPVISGGNGAFYLSDGARYGRGW
jgi:hypothetical protein